MVMRVIRSTPIVSKAPVHQASVHLPSAVVARPAAKPVAKSREESAGGGEGPDQVRVYVRVRAPVGHEDRFAQQPAVTVDAGTGDVLLAGAPLQRKFVFDGVFGQEASQGQIFTGIGQGLAAGCLAGGHECIFAYGPIGSGKTYTLFGSRVSSAELMWVDPQRGLACRTLESIFGGLRELGPGCNCECSFLEVYMEQINDLLQPARRDLKVSQGAKDGIHVEGLTRRPVKSLDEALQALWAGLQERHHGQAQTNAQSSRSHVVFTLFVELPSAQGSCRKGSLTFIDLAGSERHLSMAADHLTASHCSLQAREGQAIRKGLAALTSVFQSLSQAKKPAKSPEAGLANFHLSKLTMLLRNCLGKSSATSFLANVSPSAQNFAMTLSTLQLAASVRHIRCAKHACCPPPAVPDGRAADEGALALLPGPAGDGRHRGPAAARPGDGPAKAEGGTTALAVHTERSDGSNDVEELLIELAAQRARADAWHTLAERCQAEADGNFKEFRSESELVVQVQVKNKEEMSEVLSRHGAELKQLKSQKQHLAMSTPENQNEELEGLRKRLSATEDDLEAVRKDLGAERELLRKALASAQRSADELNDSQTGLQAVQLGGQEEALAAQCLKLTMQEELRQESEIAAQARAEANHEMQVAQLCHDAEIEMLRQRVQRESAMLDRQRGELDIARRRLSKTEEDLDTTASELMRERELLAALRANGQQMTTQLAHTQAALGTAQSQRNEALAATQQLSERMQEELKGEAEMVAQAQARSSHELAETVSCHSAELAKLELEVQHERQASEHQRGELDILRQGLAKAKEDLEATRKDLARERDLLMTSHAAGQQATAQLTDAWESLGDARREGQEEALAAQKLQQQLEEEKATHAAALALRQAQVEQARALAQKASAEAEGELALVRQHYTGLLEGEKKVAAKVQADAANILAQLELAREQLDNAKAECEVEHDMAHMCQSQANELEKRCLDYAAELAQRDAEIARLQQAFREESQVESQRTNEAWEQQLNDARRDLAAARKELGWKHELVVRTRVETENAVARLNQEHAEELCHKLANHAGALVEKDAQVEQAKKEVEQLQVRWAEAEEPLLQRLSEAEWQLDAIREDFAYQQELSRLQTQSEWRQAIAELREAHVEDANRANQVHVEALAHRDAELGQVLLELQQERQRAAVQQALAVQASNQQHHASLEALAQRDVAIGQAHLELEKERERIAQEHAQVVCAWQQRLEDAEGSLEVLQEQLDQQRGLTLQAQVDGDRALEQLRQAQSEELSGKITECTGLVVRLQAELDDSQRQLQEAGRQRSEAETALAKKLGESENSVLAIKAELQRQQMQASWAQASHQQAMEELRHEQAEELAALCQQHQEILSQQNSEVQDSCRQLWQAQEEAAKRFRKSEELWVSKQRCAEAALKASQDELAAERRRGKDQAQDFTIMLAQSAESLQQRDQEIAAVKEECQVVATQTVHTDAVWRQKFAEAQQMHEATKAELRSELQQAAAAQTSCENALAKLQKRSTEDVFGLSPEQVDTFARRKVEAFGLRSELQAQEAELLLQRLRANESAEELVRKSAAHSEVLVRCRAELHGLRQELHTERQEAQLYQQMLQNKTPAPGDEAAGGVSQLPGPTAPGDTCHSPAPAPIGTSSTTPERQPLVLPLPGDPGTPPAAALAACAAAAAGGTPASAARCTPAARAEAAGSPSGAHGTKDALSSCASTAASAAAWSDSASYPSSCTVTYWSTPDASLRQSPWHQLASSPLAKQEHSPASRCSQGSTLRHLPQVPPLPQACPRPRAHVEAEGDSPEQLSGRCSAGDTLVCSGGSERNGRVSMVPVVARPPPRQQTSPVLRASAVKGKVLARRGAAAPTAPPASPVSLTPAR